MSIADRYATALFEVTEAKGNTGDVLETLTALKDSLLANKRINEVLNTPMISDIEKVAVIKNAIGPDLNEELSSFFQLVSKNNRLSELPSIVKAFEDKTSEEMGIETGTVRSAVELTTDERSKVQKIIENKLSKKVELEFKVDAGMIGGIEAKVGSYIFEDSIKSHMQKLNDFITRRVQ